MKCDTAGCTNDAEWRVRGPKAAGSRFCDPCKRDITQYEKECCIPPRHLTSFVHERK